MLKKHSPLSLRSFWWCTGLATALGAALIPLPLVGKHGVESALVLGVVLPMLSAALAARLVAAARAGCLGRISGPGLLRDIALCGAWLFALPNLALALGAVTSRACEPWKGLSFMLAGPLPGTVLAAVLGGLLAATTRRGWLGTLLAVLPPLLGLAGWAYEFYGTPAVFAFGHFFGYFPGALYDRQVHLPETLLHLRAVSALLAMGAAWMFLARVRAPTYALSGPGAPGRRAWAGLGALSLGVVITLLGAEFGFRSDHRRIAEVLGGYHRSERCELFVPRGMKHKRRFGRDCDVRVAQAEAYLGVRMGGPLRAYVFRSAGQKRALMGAQVTNIAKPWRREIYLHEAGWPHPVLSHEVAHVVAAEFGRGPFKVSGQLSGYLPNPGIVEGLAVATAFRPKDGLTPDQWARASLDLGMAPRLSELLGQGFFARSARLAYTLSGSFLRFLHGRYGAKALRRIYTEGDVSRALQRPLDELEAQWHDHLRSVELSNEGLSLAQLRFAKRGLFSAICPHRIADLRAALAQDVAANDLEAALTACDAILDTDPSQTGTRIRRIGVLARLGRQQAALDALDALQKTPGIGAAAVAQAKHTLADELFRADDRERARHMYGVLLREPLTPDMRRLVEVKASSLEGSRRQAKLVQQFLIGGGAEDGLTAIHLLRELREVRSDGLPHYLEARQLMFRNRFAAAERLFAQARELTLPTETLTDEALRAHAICALASGNRDRAAKLFETLSGVSSPALRWQAQDWLSRMDIERQQGD